MGSNVGSFQPTLEIRNNKFLYTTKQNSYRFEKSKKVKFISRGKFRQSSIDSILSILQGLKDTTIYKVNSCIMSGVIFDLTVAHGADTAKFSLHNTFDLTALKIVNIINPYLPRHKKLGGSIELIKKEEECWIYLKNLQDKNLKQ